MTEHRRYALKKFHHAVAALKEGVANAHDDLDKDGVIQRFEFTFELAWKTLKIVLEDEGVECRTPKGCLRAAFRVGLIHEEKQFLDLLEDRNKTSHLYDQEESEKIFKRIQSDYLGAFLQLENRLEEWDKQNEE